MLCAPAWTRSEEDHDGPEAGPQCARGDEVGVWAAMAVRTEDSEEAEAHPGGESSCCDGSLAGKTGAGTSGGKRAFQVGEAA